MPNELSLNRPECPDEALGKIRAVYIIVERRTTFYAGNRRLVDFRTDVQFWVLPPSNHPVLAMASQQTINDILPPEILSTIFEYVLRLAEEPLGNVNDSEDMADRFKSALSALEEARNVSLTQYSHGKTAF